MKIYLNRKTLVMFIDARRFQSETSISSFSQEMLHILSSHGDRVHLAVPDVGRELPEDHEAAVDPGGDVTASRDPVVDWRWV